jgi:putative nucleotidyltransferase with HDIG domain
MQFSGKKIEIVSIRITVEATGTTFSMNAAKELRLDSEAGPAFFLPPGFEIVPRLLMLLDRPESDSEKLAEVIRVDTALTADVLRISNSAYFAGAQRIETIRDAILRIGLREIYRVVMKVVASPVFQASQRTPVARLDLWKHSFAAAVAAHVLARKIGQDPEVAFTAALLHDIGKVVLAQAHGVKYIALVEESTLENHGVRKLEEHAFHTNHATIGGRLLQQWNFPENIAASVSSHHEPLRAARPHVALTAITYLANILAYRIGRGFGFPQYVVNPNAAVFKAVSMESRDFDELQQEVADEFEQEEIRFR